MHIGKIDHVNLRTTQLDAMIKWYEDILGMKHGHRPDFSSQGAWMYVGDHPLVHLVAIEGPPATGSEVPLKLEHFALSATGRAEFEAHLKKSDETYRSNEIPAIRMIQFNVWDPDGNHVHVDFSTRRVIWSFAVTFLSAAKYS